MRRILLSLFLVAGLVAGCATAPTTVNDRLYFGRSIPGGGEVTDAQWTAFVDEVIVPRFPDGFSVSHGDGHWKGDDGKAVSEHSSVFEVTHAADPKIDARLEEIAKTYRARFNQDAVLRVRTPAEITFWRR